MADEGRSEPGAVPAIRYAAGRYRLIVLLGLVLTGGLLADGIMRADGALVVAAIAGLVLVALFGYSARAKLRPSAVALAREGELLVGGELSQPLMVAQTTFEVVPDHQGSWVIVLSGPEGTTRLGAGGWRVEGERLFTRAVAERALVELGLTQRDQRGEGEARSDMSDPGHSIY